MRTEKRAVVLAICLLTLGALWLGAPPQAEAGPAFSRSGVKLEISVGQCVRRAERSVADLQRTDRDIRTESDDDTVWLSNDSFTAMIWCLRIEGASLAVIVVGSGSRDLSRSVKDNLRRGMT